MAAPKIVDRVCQRCEQGFQGSRLQRVCDPCKVMAGRDCDPSKLADRECLVCGAGFRGHKVSKRCVPCEAAYQREYNLNRKKVDYEAKKALVAGLKRPKLPPPCARCHYCKETDQYSSGMVCLAESFMRCAPWSPGAKPLKERENV